MKKDNYDLYMHPAIIAVCVNCGKVSCDHGKCREILDKVSELKSKYQSKHGKESLYEYNGETHNIREWSEITGISYDALQSRLYKGWKIEKALTHPVMRGGRRHAQ